MTANELFKSGKLTDAIDAQVADVKAHPADQGKRLFLFEMLAFHGDLERARRQIEAINHDEPELVAATQAYRKLLDSEQLRRRLFNDGHKPEFLVPPPEHVGHRLEAVHQLRGHHTAEAAKCLAQAAAVTLLGGSRRSSSRRCTQRDVVAHRCRRTNSGASPRICVPGGGDSAPC